MNVDHYTAETLPVPVKRPVRDLTAKTTPGTVPSKGKRRGAVPSIRRRRWPRVCPLVEFARRGAQ